MAVVSGGAASSGGLRRDAATWYGYLLIGYFTYASTSQGNILPFLKADLDLSYGLVSLHSSAIAVGLMIVGLIAERFIDRFGRRAMLAVGAAGMSGGMLLLALASSPWLSIGSCFLIGVTGGFVMAIVPAMLSDIYGDRRDVAITESNAVCYLFALAAPLISGFAVLANLNWRIVLVVGVLGVFAIVPPFWRAAIPPARPASATANHPLPPAYWGYWAMLGFGVALEFAALLWAPSYLEKVVGLSVSSAAIGAGAFFVAMLVGRTVGIRLVRIYSPRRLFFALSTTTLVGFLFYCVKPDPILSIVGLFLIGLGISLLFPISLGFALRAAGAASDRAAARSNVAPGAAVLLTPPLLGSFADVVGLWTAQIMIPVFCALSVAAFLVGQYLERRAYSASSSS